MNRISVKNIITRNLSTKQIKDLCNLKKKHWKFSLNEQLKWFEKNAHTKDNHVLIYSKFILVGYVHLGLRKIIINSRNKKYILFRNLIVNKNFRNKKISSLIMKYVNNYIIKKKKIGFLICKKKLCNFYIKYNWEKISKHTNTLLDHKNKKMKFMIYNNKIGTKKFYYYC